MTLLLLGGTAEGRALADALAAARLPAVVSLAGAVRQPAPLALPTRIGGFGGEEGFAAYLATNGITAVIDATHPFAERISRRSAAVCAARNLPYLRVERPGWEPGPGDRWTWIATEEEAAQHVPPGATVFLATGRQTLGRFANLVGRRVFCRQIDPPAEAFPFADGAFVVGRPPFSRADEVALFRRLGVDVLVVKNAGGAASRSKLDAARDLGLPVLMIRRPPPPDAPAVTGVAAAVDWARALAGARLGEGRPG